MNRETERERERKERKEREKLPMFILSLGTGLWQLLCLPQHVFCTVFTVYYCAIYCPFVLQTRKNIEPKLQKQLFPPSFLQ